MASLMGLTTCEEFRTILLILFPVAKMMEAIIVNRRISIRNPPKILVPILTWNPVFFDSAII
jgi:hypothetical protein